MRRVIIASNNKNKVKEISAILQGSNCEFLTLKEAGIESDPVEDADTFVGNALIKARAAFEKSAGVAVLADDSGLMVDALDGAPGVFSSRFAGEGADDDANNALLLEKLSDVPADERSARFVCTMVLIDEAGCEHICEGSVEGMIGYFPKGDKGFGYDPLFYPEELGGDVSFSEVDDEVKNSISHRSRALGKVKSILFNER